MKNNEEFFEFMETLIEELETLGEENTAETIKSAQEISTVPGEILGALRLELKRLREKKVYLLLKSKRGVKDALNYLDSILGTR